MPQMRRKSSIRTATGATQEQFLDRVRQVAEDPTLLLPEVVGPEPAPLARLRRKLEQAKDGKLPFTARFDKGLLGAVRAARQVAAMSSAPRLLDARIDGNRRFYLQRGQAKRLVNLGVQNWDDPLALLLAYGPLAVKHGLHFFAGSQLWCTGSTPRPPPPWFADLAERTGVDLVADDDGAACPHADRPRVELRLRGGPRILVCGDCGHEAKDEAVRNMHGHVLNRCCIADQPSRPVDVTARLPGGAEAPLTEGAVLAYRQGRNNEADLLEVAVKAWRGQVGAQGSARFVLGARDFGGDQEAFLTALDIPDWEREPLRILTAGGHVGEATGLADVLATHRDRLPAALDALLGPGEGAGFVARHPGVEARTILRLAREEGERRAKTRGLPKLEGLGELGAWIDTFAREARTKNRAELLQRVRREAQGTGHPAHYYAFLVALGMESEGARSFGSDQKEAGKHWAPLAKRILEAEGEAYREALLAYLRETGAGETA